MSYLYNIDSGDTGSERNVYIKDIKERYPSYTDDQLLGAAIALAQSNGGESLIIWDGTDIHFSGSTTYVCKLFGGIDFNGSKIYMPNHDGGIILDIVPDTTSNITASATDILTGKVTDQNLYGKVFALNNNTAGNSDMCLGHRAGDHDESIYWTPTVVTNPDGLYATGDLYLTPSTGDVLCQNVHDLPKNNFEICNGTIITNSNANMSLFMRCRRSNVHLHGFVLSGRSGITAFHYGVFLFRYCYGVEIDHVYGINPVALPTSGYAIGLFSVSGVYVHDCSVGDGLSWGAIGSNNLMNTVFERCNFNRWDCHYAQCGYNVIRDCVLNEIAYGIGNGIISIENCMLKPDASSAEDINLIYLRPDMVGAFDGDIIIKGCVFKIGNQAKNKLNIVKDGCIYALPNDTAIDWISEKRRIIENCQFPDGCNKILIVGSTESSDSDLYSKISYAIKDCVIDCSDSVIDSLNSVQETVGNIAIENCDIKTQCYITKALTDTPISVNGCKFGGNTARIIQNSKTIRVNNSDLSAIVADSASAELIATGNNISGSQSVSNFTKYALAGNVASDMESVNKNS